MLESVQIKLAICRAFPYIEESWREELVIKRPSFWCAGLGIVGIALLLAAISFGQETGSTSQQADRDVATVVQVIVTGSLIPTAEEVSPNPVFSINRDLINKSGGGTTEQLLQRLPVMNGATI